MSDRLYDWMWIALHRTWFRRMWGAPLWSWLLILVIVTFTVCGFYFGVPSRCSDDGCPYQW